MNFRKEGELLIGPRGTKISVYHFQNTNKRPLVETIEKTFNFNVTDDYLPYLISNGAIVYHEIDYKGLVIVIPVPAKGVPPHIKTVAVRTEFQSSGVGGDLMHLVLDDFPRSNLRSQPIPERELANIMYRKLFGRPTKFKNVNGTDYNGYFGNHSKPEKRKALDYMGSQPDAFVKKTLEEKLNYQPQPLLTS